MLSKPDVTVARKTSLRWHKEEILSGFHLFWVTLDGCVINHYSSTTVHTKVKQYECIECILRIRPLEWAKNRLYDYSSSSNNKHGRVLIRQVHLWDLDITNNQTYGLKEKNNNNKPNARYRMSKQDHISLVIYCVCICVCLLGLSSVRLVDYHSSGCSPHQYVFKAFILPNWAPLFSVLMMARERIACQCEWLGLNWAAVYTLHKAMAQITLRIENGAWERPLRACGTEIKYKPHSLIRLLRFSSSSLHPCHSSILLNVFFFLTILCYIHALCFAKWCIYVFIRWRMSFYLVCWKE